jgi:hypothetical protein
MYLGADLGAGPLALGAGSFSSAAVRFASGPRAVFNSLIALAPFGKGRFPASARRVAMAARL